jgi:hypothetical protein
MTRSVGACSLAVLLLGACSKSAPPVQAKDGEAGLRELFISARAACDAQNVGKGRAIVASIIPTKAQLSRALADDVPSDFVEQVASQSKELPSDDAKTACLLSPAGRTEILVHRATTEEIAARSTEVVAKEFPRGAQKLAPFLRPAATFYEVETVEPGADKGTKFHMFYWDGAQWRMLGPAWRYLTGAEPE